MVEINSNEAYLWAGLPAYDLWFKLSSKLGCLSSVPRVLCARPLTARGWDPWSLRPCPPTWPTSPHPHSGISNLRDIEMPFMETEFW